MVAEMPNAQCVGREFVRQYYLLLNEAPEYLHRFYSSESSFSHSDIDTKQAADSSEPIVGQVEIFKKIKSLNFHDCHTKIRQVDSQLTISNSVVVQVMGEFSNNGFPMRRFMQTFVLVPQSARQYYVHNDIFRFQDVVYNTEASESELEISNESTTKSDMDDVTAPSDEKNEVEPEATDAGVVMDSTNDTKEDCLDQNVAVNGQEPATMVNGQQEEESTTLNGSMDQPTTDSKDQSIVENGVVDVEQQPTANGDVAISDVAADDGPVDEPSKSVKEEFNDSSAYTKKPVSWAALAGKSSSAGSKQPETVVVPTKNGNNITAEDQWDTVQSKTQRKQQPDGSQNTDTDRSPASDSDDSFRKGRYPDSHQLFVGNLPHNLTDRELRNFFEEFGPVIDMRIRASTRRDLPNFGFVIFENIETVQKLLSIKPLLLGGRHRLNVEEKKQRFELNTTQPKNISRRSSRGLVDNASDAAGYRNGYKNYTKFNNRSPSTAKHQVAVM